MGKKIFYWTCGILMVLSFGFGLAAQRINPQQAGGEITTWTLAIIFLAQPIFYGCLGAVSGVKLFSGIEKEGKRKLSLWAGILLSLLFLLIGILEVSGHPVTNPYLGVIRLLFKYPVTFLLPGILLGLGLFEKE